MSNYGNSFFILFQNIAIKISILVAMQSSRNRLIGLELLPSILGTVDKEAVNHMLLTLVSLDRPVNHTSFALHLKSKEATQL